MAKRLHIAVAMNSTLEKFVVASVWLIALLLQWVLEGKVVKLAKKVMRGKVDCCMFWQN